MRACNSIEETDESICYVFVHNETLIKDSPIYFLRLHDVLVNFLHFP